MPDAVIILVTCKAGEGLKLGQVLIEEQLAACANVIPGISSIFRWQGKVQIESEELLRIKA
jgi:periplasmic divalent cation tolerance protein